MKMWEVEIWNFSAESNVMQLPLSSYCSAKILRSSNESVKVRRARRIIPEPKTGIGEIEVSKQDLSVLWILRKITQPNHVLANLQFLHILIVFSWNVRVYAKKIK